MAELKNLRAAEHRKSANVYLQLAHDRAVLTADVKENHLHYERGSVQWHAALKEADMYSRLALAHATMFAALTAVIR
jgi:hypothetical protein